MNGKEVTSDLDCADCLCAVCAKSIHTSIENEKVDYLKMDCDPCNNCEIGDFLTEVEEDCPHGFLGDDSFFNETEWENNTCRTSKDGSQIRLTTQEADHIYRLLGKYHKELPAELKSFMEEMWDEFYDGGR